jgi:phosphotriesterase-related protein
MQVDTLRGPVPTEDLGFVLTHEHIFAHTEGLVHQFPQVWDESAAIVDARRQLQEAYDAGIRTIIEHSVMGLGRDVPMFLKVAENSPVNVVVATGLYYFDELPFYFQYQPIEHMIDLFVHDLTVGVQNTRVKAGFLKTITDKKGVTEGIDKLLRAIARAHRQTGKLISTHTDAPARTGLEQQRVFAEEGVDLTRIIIGHSGDTDDTDYLKMLMDKGTTLDMGRISIHQILPNDTRVRVIASLCKEGYADRMTMSHDMQCACTFIPQQFIHEFAPDAKLTYIPQTFIPQLIEAGVTEAEIDLMTVRNPKRVFDRQGAY